MTTPQDTPFSTSTRLLTGLAKHQVARVVSLASDGSGKVHDQQVVQRLKELGFLPGARLRVTGFGFLGRDPIAVEINGTKFALRRTEAQRISVRLD